MAEGDGVGELERLGVSDCEGESVGGGSSLADMGSGERNPGAGDGGSERGSVRSCLVAILGLEGGE